MALQQLTKSSEITSDLHIFLPFLVSCLCEEDTACSTPGFSASWFKTISGCLLQTAAEFEFHKTTSQGCKVGIFFCHLLMIHSFKKGKPSMGHSDQRPITGKPWESSVLPPCAISPLLTPRPHSWWSSFPSLIPRAVTSPAPPYLQSPRNMGSADAL